ncbi:MAG TPA: MaoC family dehydratase [Streptosporangiaceae bacterium]|nr:MaoC family dehydratase [Streptosporangiaceae bacterium]
MTGNDTITGPVRSPRNLAANITGSIHDDATAASLGFRGGTVAGSIHMDQFAPLLLEGFGQHWFETGSLSLYFRHATTDGEPVQAFLERPERGEPDAQVRAWATTGEDTLVTEGTASVGNPASAAALYSRDLRPVDPGELRILSAMKPGLVLGDYRHTVDAERQYSAIRQGAMTEPLDWYTATSPWGGPIASPSAVVGLLYTRLLADANEAMGAHVGLFGAIEVRFRHGPVFLDRSYRVTGEVAALSQTPKTEVLWFDSRALDDNGNVVAQMRMMLRQMKQSSPLYDETAAPAERG